MIECLLSAFCVQRASSVQVLLVCLFSASDGVHSDGCGGPSHPQHHPTLPGCALSQGKGELVARCPYHYGNH